MFKGPTYKASLYFQQQLFLKVLRQCGKSFGDQNTIKVFCHPSEKNKNKNKNVQFLTLTAESTLVSDLIYEKKNLTPLPELTMCAHALIVWNSAPARMLWLSRLDWVDPVQAWIHPVLRKSITFFIINIFLIIKTLWNLANILSEWLGNPGKGTLRSKNKKYILGEPALYPAGSLSIWRLFKKSLAWENRQHLAMLPLVSPPNDVWETRAKIPYWWRITAQIWVVLLIGCAPWEFWFNQSEVLPRSE